MDAADLELFARSLRHEAETHSGAALDNALGELGWYEAHAVDARSAVSLLFEIQGAANTTSSALDHVVIAALGREPARSTCVVLPPAGQWNAPGALDGERLMVRGLATAALTGSAVALVVAVGGGDEHVCVGVDTASLTLRPVRGIDPSHGLVDVTGEVPVTDVAPADWHAAVAMGQIALGHELVGASRKMLELARAHALERIQFGRPISGFQAVRHRLADTLVSIEIAEAGLDAAWRDHTPQTAAMAKALAGRGARTAARHCQQVLAGIGFTTEHPLHHYVRRILVLDEMLGPARSLTRALGQDLLATGRLPPLLPL